MNTCPVCGREMPENESGKCRQCVSYTASVNEKYNEEERKRKEELEKKK